MSNAEAFVVRWERERGFWLEADPEAKVPEDIAEAALAWVRERETWVHRRHQHIGAASVVIDPGDGPIAERISDLSEFETRLGWPSDDL